MSRFNFREWDGEGPPPEFWQRAVWNALHGKRGQAILRELREALLALPAPRLIEGAVSCAGEVCALGALAGYRFGQGIPLVWHAESLISLIQMEERLGDELEEEWTTVEIGEAMGLKQTLAWAIAYENDEGGWGNETPEQRYRRVLRWVEEQIAPEMVGATR